ncbi:RNA polymerase II subunit A C-terminal domain phosphatase [Golovinomyces cichoracearum]|uniref:RNA polymerase II subunit A C-terminal domain phosphatase n=1 Tax=Golovinomyces cichoracearum TaxID=62708 RepID=A0A420IEM7_9PEZI|nr:RNA polymerase II subunit A C-terminal domain phosphatase [Golovinomyces cichoracearum]
MGKLLRLGTNLKYPLTIGRLLKAPGDEISKQEPIMQFKFTWKQKVGDPFGYEWEEDQITIADWDSPVDGSIKVWKVHEGMVVDKSIPFVEIEESCPHSVQFAGLCGICGKDMTEVSWASASNDTRNAKINMIHDQTTLTVSEDEASKAEEELERRLIKNRKLSLVVDLDQTIIHACIEPTIGEWQNDPASPNYQAVKEVRSFQLNDDGPRGVASGCWYYIKLRPGLKEFLDKISEIYELHVYTMGTRAYAMNIAKIVDPDKRLFGDRIISRDENGSIMTKSLARIFPVNTKMVVIIDDRTDVWPKNRPNLIKVFPYDFFLGIGDINSSFLPKREEFPKATIVSKTDQGLIEEKEDLKVAEGSSTTKDTSPVANDVDNESSESNEGQKKDSQISKVSALEGLLLMGGGNDEARRLEQTAEQEKLLEKQLNERPLLHMQEILDKEEKNEEKTVLDDNLNPQEQASHRQNLLKDDDVELKHLEKHLIRLHKAFYEEYDNACAKVAENNFKSGNKDVDLNHASPDLKIVPDVGHVIPRLKAETLAGCVIVTSGLVPLQTDIIKTELGIQTISFGAKIVHKVHRHCTHLVVSSNRTRTKKVRQATRYAHIKIVNQDWLMNSISKWKKEDETPYLICSDDEKNLLEKQLHEDMAMLSTQPSDESDSSINDDAKEYRGSIQQNSTEDNLILSELRDSFSPINDLGGINWSEVDDELAEFMGEEDSENDSDASETIGLKRRHKDMSNEEESELESSLGKKQKLANARRSGLLGINTTCESQTIDQTVTYEESNMNISTPEGEESSADADLEALLMAEFEKEEVEEYSKGEAAVDISE